MTRTDTESNEEFNFNFLTSDKEDTTWVEQLSENSSLSCNSCRYFSGSLILPCAVNPSNVYDADNCPDYHE